MEDAESSSPSAEGETPPLAFLFANFFFAHTDAKEKVGDDVPTEHSGDHYTVILHIYTIPILYNVTNSSFIFDDLFTNKL